MELKNILRMTKTDRYTQDGRDELAKLQETEDVKYKTGDISQKTGLQKQPDGSWAPPKKGGKPAAKKEAGSINRTPERIAKETAIMEALNLSTGEDNNLHKMSDETIERLYARTQEKPAAGKTTIRQGPNTKTLDEPPGEHIQKNLDSYRGYKPGDMEGLVLGPSGYKKQSSSKGPDGVSSITYTKEGEEDIVLFFDKYGELKNAGTSQDREGVMKKMQAAEGLGHMKVIGDYDVYRVTSGPDKGKYKVSKVGSLEEVTMSEQKAADFLSSAAVGNKLEPDFEDEGESAGTNWQEKVEQNPRDGYNFEKMIQHRIPTSQTDREELKGLRSFMNEEKATYQNALKNRAQALVDGHKSNGDWYPEKEQAIMKIAKAVGFDEELHKFIEEENRGYDLGYSEDAAPKIRQLTGDCRIRVRK